MKKAVALLLVLMMVWGLSTAVAESSRLQEFEEKMTGSWKQMACSGVTTDSKLATLYYIGSFSYPNDKLTYTWAALTHKNSAVYLTEGGDGKIYLALVAEFASKYEKETRSLNIIGEVSIDSTATIAVINLLDGSSFVYCKQESE